MAKNLVDKKVRDEIRSNFDDNLFITAGAGTGKTHSIVSRVVEAVGRKGIAPERIAVTTFTIKAANELRYKIRRALEEEFPHTVSALQSMFVGTNGAFCLQALKERPLESEIDPDLEVLDEDDSEKIIDELARDVIRKEFDTIEGRELYTKWEFDPYSAVEFFKTLYKYRELEAVEPEDPEICTKTFWERHNDDYSEIPAIMKMNETEEPYGYSWLENRIEEWKKLNSASSEDIILYFVNLKILDTTGKLGSWTRKSLYDETSRSLLHYCLRPIEAAKNEIISYVSYELYKKYRTLYDDFTVAYSRWKRDRGFVDFPDIAMHARDLIRDSREVREYFQEKFDLVIVDEFQDTDPIMSEVLMYICQDGYRDAAWDEVKLKPGKLTLVGDGKQSIFRFRRADISIFNLVKNIFKREGKVETITQNFRSLAPLVESHNYAFERMFDPDEDSGTDCIACESNYSWRGKGISDQSRLIMLDLDIDLDTDTDVELKGKTVKTLKAEYLREREVNAVCGWIKDSVKKKKLMLDDGPAGYGDFMLLFRRRAMMQHYAGLLAREGIPAAMDGEGFLLELPEVIDIFRLMKGALCPDDSMAAAAAMRTVYAGISDEELYDHTLKGGKIKYLTVNEEKGNASVNAMLIKLREYNAYLSACSPKDGFRHVLRKEKIKYILNQTRSVMGFNIFDSLISFYDGCCGVDDSPWDAINCAWDRVYDAVKLDPSFYPFKKKKEVQLLTIHKAKGLESPAVILCDMGTKSYSGVSHIFDRKSNSLYYQFELEKRGVHKGAHRAKIYPVKSRNFDEVTPAEQAAMKKEDIRMVYVAATRARDYLIIPAYREEPAALYKELCGYYIENGLVTRQRAGLSRDYHKNIIPLPEIKAVKDDAASKAKVKKLLGKMDADRERALEKIGALSVPCYGRESFSHEKAMKRESAGYGKEYGALFHRVMEVFLRGPLTPPPSRTQPPNPPEGGLKAKPGCGDMKFQMFGEEDFWKRIDDIIKTVVYEQKVDLSDEMRGVLIGHLERVLGSGMFRECCGAEMRFAEFSVGLTELVDGVEVARLGVIDLVYKFNGVWKIVDYKTDKVEGVEHLEELEEFYGDQINGYVEAFKRVSGERVEGRLFFVDG